MSANFWRSTHAASWIFEPQELASGRSFDLSFFTEEEYQKIFIFFANFIQAIGEVISLRQQVIATATVYFRRFYAKNALKTIDPWLMAPTCVVLASKVEEFGIIPNNHLRGVCQAVIRTKFSYAYDFDYPYDVYHFVDCELYLTEFLDCSLIVYQPYRYLLHVMSRMGAKADNELFTMSWKVINDSLRTDVSLLFAPHQIALGCMQIACVILQKDLELWFAELNVDYAKVGEVIKQILSLYEMWKQWDEMVEIPSLLAKVPKPRLVPYFIF